MNGLQADGGSTEHAQGMSGARGPGRRSGRPVRAVLSRDAIGNAALELSDTAGYDSLTMKALAARLGVAPSALYNHVGAKSDLLVCIQEILMSRIDTSGFERLPLRRAVAAWARSYRDVFAAHPDVIAGIARLPVRESPRALDQYEAVAAALAGAGLARARIVSVIVAFESFIFGSALDVSAPADIFDAAGADPRAHPVFAAAVSARAKLPDNPADDAFDQGLDALLRLLDG